MKKLLKIVQKNLQISTKISRKIGKNGQMRRVDFELKNYITLKIMNDKYLPEKQILYCLEHERVLFIKSCCI